MRCLHCGKELALLKRLRGGGQFCSEAHKQSYQEEYNRIALSRLMQAQPKNTKTASSQDKPSGPESAVAPVAVVEQVEAEAVVEEVAAGAKENILEKAVQDADVQEISVPPEEVEDELCASETAGFLIEAQAAPVDVEVGGPPYVEEWLKGQPAPAMPEWLFEGREDPALPGGEVVRLELRPNLSRGEYPAPEANVTPNDFVQTHAVPPGLPAPRTPNKLGAAGPIEVQVAPRRTEASAVAVLDDFRDFPAETVVWDTKLLALFPSEIAYPAEDADVQVITPAPEDPVLEQLASLSAAEADLEASERQVEESSDAATPSLAMEALARLHQELVEYQKPAVETTETAGQEPTAPVDSETVTVIEPVAVEPVTIEPATAETREPQESVIATQAEIAKAEKPRPGLVDFTVKTFAPSKPSIMEAGGVTLESSALLPRLTGLPLRPKVGLVPPQTAQSLKAAQDKKEEARSKEPAGKQPEPVAKQPLSATPAETAAKPTTKTGPVQPAAAPRPAQPAKPVTSTAWQKPQPAAAKTANAPSADNTLSTKAPGIAKKAEALSKPKAAEKPETQPARPAKAAEPPAVKAPVQETEAPSFGISATDSNSLLGSFKVKIGLAVLGIALALVAYLMLSGKSNSHATPAAATTEKVGPSIMLGAGGWVENWAGDPSGAHYGRQITIYRPSLKLSDYRIEFQGEIDTKSLGWVFRAADPDNYYAMKLGIVSGGSAPKIALFKYIVAGGHQTQVGRVPIDMTTSLETVYNIRVDVRGTSFNTYVQGQHVDTWNDDQFKSGGVGFLNEREERGKIKSASINLLSGGKQ